MVEESREPGALSRTYSATMSHSMQSGGSRDPEPPEPPFHWNPFRGGAHRHAELLIPPPPPHPPALCRVPTSGRS